MDRWIAASALLVIGCTHAHVGGDAGMDAALRGEDAGADGGGADAGAPEDAETPRATACDPVRGVECDGDWSGRCDPACAADECCAPRGGAFSCLPRTADGRCPAADIWIDATRVEGRTWTSWRWFDAADCAVEEACVDAPGWRRLLHFDTWTPNTGTADLYLGAPEDHPELFEYSPCHHHYHFLTYARYALRDAAGAVVATGHKQSFCLMDSYRYPEEDRRGVAYSCDEQGIQVGYQDAYEDTLDCQWVDITDAPPGDGVLRFELNYAGVLLERDYDDDVSEVAVTIGDDDVTAPCPSGAGLGTSRSCGMTRGPTFSCTPGQRVRVGCSETCGLGACTGNPFLRVCDPSAGTSCVGPFMLGESDDSGCGGGRCLTGGDCCPLVELPCPASGRLTAFFGAYDPAAAATCELSLET